MFRREQRDLRRSGVHDDVIGNSGGSNGNSPVVTGIGVLICEPGKWIKSVAPYFRFDNDNRREPNRTVTKIGQTMPTPRACTIPPGYGVGGFSKQPVRCHEEE